MIKLRIFLKNPLDYKLPNVSILIAICRIALYLHKMNVQYIIFLLVYWVAVSRTYMLHANETIMESVTHWSPGNLMVFETKWNVSLSYSQGAINVQNNSLALICPAR